MEKKGKKKNQNIGNELFVDKKIGFNTVYSLGFLITRKMIFHLKHKRALCSLRTTERLSSCECR